MRILYHHRTLADGAEGVHIAEMVAAFGALGHEVRVMGVQAAPDRRAPSGILHRCRSAVPEAFIEATAVAFNAPDFWRTRRELRRHRPDVLYARHARYDVAALEAARRDGVRSVLEVNALYTVRPYRDFEPLTFAPLAVRLERRALTLATVVVAVSTPLARQVEALAQRPAIVLPNAADPQRFDSRTADAASVRARYGLDGVPVIGWSGILRSWHGLDMLLDILRAVPEAALLVVGDGPERHAIEARAQAAGVRHRLVITGRIPHAEMPDHIAAMDVAVVADERTGVASPMKLLEYMAMGRAIVAPDMENIRDLVQDRVSARLFTQGDGNGLLSAVRELVRDPALRGRLGAYARASVERERNWHQNAARALEQVELAVHGQ